MATRNIINPTTGQTGYQIPGAPLPAGWNWMSGVAPTSNTGPTTGMSSPYSPHATSGFYGATDRNSGKEQVAVTQQRGMMTIAKTIGGIDPNYINSILNDPVQTAFYINALAYGGYTFGDILQDLKRGELAFTGNSTMNSLVLIHDDLPRNQYVNTPEGKNAYNQATSLIPVTDMIGGMDQNVLRYGIDMPAEMFKTLVPVFDNTSQEFKDAVNEIKSSYQDLLAAQLSATTDAQKTIADNNYNAWKSDIERTYGVVLSDNATKAWQQIQTLGDAASKQGIQGSGIADLAIDDYLKGARTSASNLRKERLSKEEQQMAAQYGASATPAQIKALIDEDRAKGLPQDQWRATMWGLIPSAETAAAFSMETLRKNFPNKTDAELQNYRNTMVDENGNLRSALYQKYYQDIAANRQTAEAYKENTVLTDAANKESEAYRVYQNTDPFSKATKLDVANTEKNKVAGLPPPAPVSAPAPAPVPGQGYWTEGKIVNGVNVGGGTFVAGTAPKVSAPVSKPTINPAPAPRTGYAGSSIIDYLGSTGAKTDYTSRSTLAAKQGIVGYSGTAEQNTALLKKMRGY